MIWIIGHYAEKIENAAELLESFLDNFLDETTQVQLQILTAVVKLFLKRPKETQDMVSRVLNLASQESDNPDLRDRGYLYWRLLSTDPEAAKAVVLGQQPLISGTSTSMDDNLLNELIGNISTLASVYHKPPESFVKKFAKRTKEYRKEDEEDPREKELERNTSILDIDSDTNKTTSPGPVKTTPGPNLIDDFDFLTTPAQPPVSSSAKELVLPADKGNGLQISAAFVRRDNQAVLELSLNNQSPVGVNGLAMQFNKNCFGLAPLGVQLNVPIIMPGMSGEATVPTVFNQTQLAAPGTPVSNIIQMAIKATFQGQDKVLYFQMAIPIHVLFVENGKLDRDEYLGTWKTISEEHFRDINLGFGQNADTIQRRFESNRLFFIAKRSVQQQEFLYFSGRLPTGPVMLLELSLGPSGSKACCKTKNPELVNVFLQSVQSLLS
jgi:AP-1 complex subunit beta-1